MKNAIEFINVSKKFKRGRKLLLKEALVDLFTPTSTEDFWVLENATFKIEKGERVGIIGPNGSGKSTILKMIAGVMSPVKGRVNVSGRVAPLIELGAGFHPELSGRENIYLNATILGLNKAQIQDRFNSIVKFSELADFIDTPIKHYSSGMYMRLGFSIAVHTDPDILLIDEILAVGDKSFSKKSITRMNEYKEKGVTIVFVSHDLKTISEFCSRVIVLSEGKIVEDGEPAKVVNKYKKHF